MSPKRKFNEKSPESQKLQKTFLSTDQQDTEQEGSSRSKTEIENEFLSLEKYEKIKKLWFQVGENGKTFKIKKPAIDSDVSDLEKAIRKEAQEENIKLPENFTLSLVKVAGSDPNDDVDTGKEIKLNEIKSSFSLLKVLAPLQDVDVIDQVLIRIEGKGFELVTSYFD